MKIGIVGSGTVGQQLGLGFVRLGHAVKIGTRETGKLKDWLKEVGEKGSAGSPEEVAKFAELAVVATKWAGTEQALKLAGPKNLAGKIVIDVTNPLDDSKGMPPSFAATPGNSGGERVQRWLADSKVVKAFNMIGAHIMCKPKRAEGMPDLFIAGNDAEAKKKIASFAQQWGWPEVIDLGDISKAFWLETLAMVWITYAFKNNSWEHAFKLLRK